MANNLDDLDNIYYTIDNEMRERSNYQIKRELGDWGADHEYMHDYYSYRNIRANPVHPSVVSESISRSIQGR